MKTVSNKFGKGVLFEGKDIQEDTYCIGCACMSIQSEMLSFANMYPFLFTKTPISQSGIGFCCKNCPIFIPQTIPYFWRIKIA